MKKLTLLFALLLSINIFGQSPSNILLRIYSSNKSPKYQEQVELKAYLVNKSSKAIEIVAPNKSEPGWRFYKNEWKILNDKGDKINPKDFLDAPTSRFSNQSISVIPAGDSLCIRTYNFKFSEVGTFSISYYFDHDPKYSNYFNSNVAAKKLSVVSVTSNILHFTIKKSKIADFTPMENITQDFLDRQKVFKSLDDAFKNAEKVFKLEVTDIKQSDFNDICLLKNLKYLTINNSKIDTIPEAFSNLNLVGFSLELKLFGTNNPVLIFPKEINNMSGLTSFFVKGWSTLVFPEKMGNLKSLKEFSTLNGHYKKLPDDFGSVENLNSITIRDNDDLESLPNFTNLKNLTMVDISNCKKITSFPSIFNSTMLVSLTLDNDAITSIPAEISALKSLSYLILSSNQLSVLPVQITELTKIQLLNVSNNPLNKKDNTLKLIKKTFEGKIFL